MYFQMGRNFLARTLFFCTAYKLHFFSNKIPWIRSVSNKNGSFHKIIFNFFEILKYGFCIFLEGTMVPEHTNFTLQQNGPSRVLLKKHERKEPKLMCEIVVPMSFNPREFSDLGDCVTWWLKIISEKTFMLATY